MKLFNIIAVLITVSAAFSYINHRFIRLPTTIGLMVMALVVSLGLIILGPFGLGLEEGAHRLLNSIDFDETLLHGMLSFLLFAGALHIDLDRLRRQKWIIGTLATVGTVTTTFIIGILAWFVLDWLNIGLPLMHCLLFGALISPTDPIAVLGILKKVGVPESLPVAPSKLAHNGLLLMLKVSESPSGSAAWGRKEYGLPACTSVAGLPEMVGGLLGASTTVMEKSER